MAEAVSHRGPDDYGVWCDASAGISLGHRRLAILDLSAAGHQPMGSPSGRYVLVFNGEIYNHRDLRAELESVGVIAWRGHSDTEILLAGFDTWGIAATVVRTVGMFAFAVWDRHTRTLTLARDRLGEKPLYYGWQKDAFLFASELKALERHPSFEAAVSRDAAAAFLSYGYVPTPGSIYEGISKLTPGSCLEVDASTRTLREPIRYWSLLDVAKRGIAEPFKGSETAAINELEERLRDAVSLQQVADVPLGAFLSGGIDSTTIVALIQAQSSRPMHTFTIGYADERFNEARHARLVAEHLGTDHTELYVTPTEARSVIPDLAAIYDEPFGDSSQIPTVLVSKLARQTVTVSLSGDGGDELFGGYSRYVWARNALRFPAMVRNLLAGLLESRSAAAWDRTTKQLYRILPASLGVPMFGDKAHKLAAMLGFDSIASLYQHLSTTWPRVEPLVLGAKISTDRHDGCLGRSAFDAVENYMMGVDTLTYLPDDILCKVDRASMSVSLETRAPFLDHRVVEFAWRLPLKLKFRRGRGKWILRRLLDKYVPRTLVERPKMGFAVPIGEWLRTDLREWAEDLLSDARLRRDGFLDPGPVRQKWAEHLTGNRNWQFHLWNVLMFQAWLNVGDGND
jgi:asparagine synthase (glutamine-hydrolysing)